MCDRETTLVEQPRGDSSQYQVSRERLPKYPDECFSPEVEPVQSEILREGTDAWGRRLMQ